MKIKFYTVGETSYIEAFPDNDDLEVANRLEGAGVPIKLTNRLCFFRHKFDNIHPDVLGAVCLAIFYPFIGKRVEFPDPVSSRLVETINRPIFTKDKEIDVLNVDNSLEKYAGNGGYVLAFGGGIDSSAVRVMFPEAFIVHEGSIRNGVLMPDLSNNLTKKMEAEGIGKLIPTNQRYLSDPWGWHVWIGSTVTAVLIASQIESSYVLTGSNFGSSFLQNGRKYFDRARGQKYHGKSGNYWEQIFWDIGLPVFSPISGMSEILNMKVSFSKLPKNNIIYCTNMLGAPCYKCSKCFRRACIEEFITGKSANYSNYMNAGVMKILDTKPTYFGHLYTTMLNNNWNPPEWIKSRLTHLPDKIDFALRHNHECYNFFPDEIKDDIKSRLVQFSDPMTEEDLVAIHSWDQTERH